MIDIDELNDELFPSAYYKARESDIKVAEAEIERLEKI